MGKFIGLFMLLSVAMLASRVVVDTRVEQELAQSTQLEALDSTPATRVVSETVETSPVVAPIVFAKATLLNFADLCKTGTVVAHFRSDNSRLSGKQEEVLQELAKKYGDKVQFISITVEEEADLCKIFKIDRAPSLLVFFNGRSVQFKTEDSKVTKNLVGFRSADKLSRLIDAAMK